MKTQSLHFNPNFNTTIGSTLKGRKSRRKRSVMVNLMLTPMVDMFSLLVIFLLQFFSTSPDFYLTENVDLPSSYSSTDLKDAPLVSVSKSDLYVDHKMVGNLDAMIQNPEPFALALEQIRKKWAADHPEEEFLGTISLEADKDIESSKISRVMAVMTSQHFGSINLIAYGE